MTRQGDLRCEYCIAVEDYPEGVRIPPFALGDSAEDFDLGRSLPDPIVGPGTIARNQHLAEDSFRATHTGHR